MPFTGASADAIAREEARVARLESELKESQAALESLRAELSAARLSPPAARGGFGNLIALPLQHGPRQAGNTIFLDEHLVPHPDQWRFLAGHTRIKASAVDEIAREAARKGMVVGVQLSDTADSDTTAPWNRLPSGQPRARFSTPPPREVHAVLAQRLFVAKAGLAPPHLNHIKRLAAFQNPEFYKKQSLRLSTALIPRVIA